MARDEQQAMTSERLAEITRRLHEAAGMPVEATTQIERDGLALLAEVERLRAEMEAKEEREAALLAVVERVAEDAEVFGWQSESIEQARALLASADSERSGGDGA